MNRGKQRYMVVKDIFMSRSKQLRNHYKRQNIFSTLYQVLQSLSLLL